MLYENALKVIPISRKPLQLGNAFNIRLMQPEIMQIYPSNDGVGFLYCQKGKTGSREVVIQKAAIDYANHVLNMAPNDKAIAMSSD